MARCRRIKTYPKGRRCFHCNYPLSIYNPNSICFAYYERTRQAADTMVEEKYRVLNQLQDIEEEDLFAFSQRRFGPEGSKRHGRQRILRTEFDYSFS